jgi:chromosome segregation ATPase
MSEEITKGMPHDPSFEVLVLARLDAIDGRLQALKADSQRSAVDTKPIWERALAEILELKQGQAELKQGQAELKQGQAELQQGLAEVQAGLSSVERQIGVLSGDVIHVRADQRHLERRLDKLEPKPVQ